jgi:hypothetical protein
MGEHTSCALAPPKIVQHVGRLAHGHIQGTISASGIVLRNFETWSSGNAGRVGGGSLRGIVRVIQVENSRTELDEYLILALIPLTFN